jgi:hypothetical protein
MLRLIHRAGSCENGPCPNVFDVAGDGRSDMIAVQGTTMTGNDTPAHQSVVLVPRQLILDYADLFPVANAAESEPNRSPFDVSGDRSGKITIRGETMTDASALAQLSGMPPHESVVLVPRRLVLEYADRIRKESMVDA